jgi:hypothetical protein
MNGAAPRRDQTETPDRLKIGIALSELLLIGLWALWVGRAYLNFDPTVWPSGRELGMVIRTHYIWTLLSRCGDCVLWNGFINGGAPAFAELQGAVLHPLVILATMIWGGINGTKVVLLGSLVMAGWAQWWLARVMGLGRLARLWSAAGAVVGGHLAGRMEHGVVGLVLSTAACSLVIPPLWDWVSTGRRRSLVLLAVTLAGALLSGQTYMQLALVLTVFPAFVVFALDPQRSRRRLLKGLAFALILAIMLSGVFLVPLLHFLPNFSKDLDPTFGSVQPLEYLPLNLVIRDLGYYYSSWALDHWPIPYLYLSFIGWIPVLLALVPLRLAPRARRRDLLTLLLAILLVYLCASAVILQPLRAFLPTAISGLRYVTVSSGLAVPLVLALAAWGLDLGLQRLKRRCPLAIRLPQWKQPVTIWPLLVVPVLMHAVHIAYDFGQTWLYTVDIPPEIYALRDELRTASAQWISPPYGEHVWTPPALDAGLKLTRVAGPWRWEGRHHPQPYLELNEGIELTLHKNSEYVYAAVTTAHGTVACPAESMGGHINVVCETDVPGVLIVKENYWTGWRAWRDGEPTPFAAKRDWLTVTVPAGEHHVTFRYRPWDVPVGAVITGVGMTLCVLLWLYPVAAILGLATLNRWADQGIDQRIQAAARIYERVRTLDIGDQHMLRRIAWLLNGLAGVTLLSILGLRLWGDASPNAFVMRYLVILFFVIAGAGVLILLKYRSQRKKTNRRPLKSAADERS